MNALINLICRAGLLKQDLDYRLIRASMVLMFLMFGYQKWFSSEAQPLVSFLGNSPLASCLHPLLGVRGISFLLGAAEWALSALLLAGFWSRTAGILGALGSVAASIGTLTMTPFVQSGWDLSQSNFPALIDHAFQMKDVVLLAVSLYLLDQDAVRYLETSAWIHDPRSRPNLTHRPILRRIAFR